MGSGNAITLMKFQFDVDQKANERAFVFVKDGIIYGLSSYWISNITHKRSDD